MPPDRIHPSSPLPFPLCPVLIRYKHYSHASDVWSFGVLMWEVYSKGKSPWSEYSGIETVLAIANGKRLAPSEITPEV